MAGEPDEDFHAGLQQHLEELVRAEREADAEFKRVLSSLDATGARGFSEAEAEAVKADLIASAASTRAHLQGLRADIERRLGRDPPKGRREQMQQMLEDMDLAQQRLEKEAERRRAQLASMGASLGPLQEYEAALAQMVSDLDAAVADGRAHLAGARAEILRGLDEGTAPPA